MANALEPALTKKTFQNWLKGALAVLFTREGLTEFVKAEISDFQRDLLQSIFTKNGIPLGTTCSSCTTANMLRCPTQDFCDKRGKCKLHDQNVPNKNPNQKCPQNICHNVKDAILKQHRFQGPTWQITDATRWCSDALQIAKCYLPPKGYDNKGSFDEIDFNGTMGVIINNTRFQNQMTAQINTVCSKVRDMINENIRHSASYELSDIDLARCIDALRDLLQDSKFLLHDQHAQDAVNKLNQLQNNTLVITAGDINKVLDEDISKRISDQQQEAIQSILDNLRKVKEASVTSLGEISDERDTAIKAIQKEAEQQIKNVKEVVAETDDILFKALKEDIITYYREHKSVIPASPLVDEHNVPIEELYVLPPMRAYRNSYFEPNMNKQKEDVRKQRKKTLGNDGHDKKENETSGNDDQEKQNITISELFLSGDVRYRKIYITANAGFGKTSLSQKLTMTWCQAHAPLTSLTEKYKGGELSAMKYFDLLFLLHLRDYQSEPKCNLDDMIMKMVSANMSQKSQFTTEFIERILHEKKCLVILDGLDEWSHPAHCQRKPDVPHNNHPGSCTVLTTTRDWKIGTIGLSPKDIDRRVEISMLNAMSRNLLEKNAIKILNEGNFNLAGKNIADFDKEVKTVQIGNIIYIPYILLQLICLFFGGLPIGKSKCQIYSKITEFTLERGLHKKNLPDMHVKSNDNAAIPNCMNENETCTRYFTLLMKLGKLAFYTLFSNKKESSLIFDRKIVTQYMNEQEIEFCLKVGLLCQTKDSSIIAVKRYRVFFQHKSVHEFFSAIYLTSEWQNESVKSAKSTLFKTCSSLSSTLEMENLFVFVCGMKPEVYACISGELQKIVDLDGVTRRYACRTDIYSGYFDDMDTILSYQSMQMQCLHESMRNENESYPFYFYVVIDRINDPKLDLAASKTIIHFNKGHVKSLVLFDYDEKTVFMHSLDPGVFTYLETLKVETTNKEPVWLANILTESARTLKCLTLSAAMPLSDISTTALTGLTFLQSLYLAHVHLTHSNLQCLYAYISQTTTLTQLTLKYMHCLNHTYQQHRDCVVILDLHCLNELKKLDLDIIPCRELNVNPACLTLSLGSSSLYDISITALAGLTCLRSLYLDKVNMTHSNLKWLYAYISQTTRLTHLKLISINCSDHNYQDRECDVIFDLHRLNELKVMYLDKLSCSELHVNPACLEKLEFQPRGGEMTARSSTTLWQDLRAAPVLSSLTLKLINFCQEMIQTIASLTQLQYLKLEWINMDDVIPLSPAMKKLERVELSYVNMTFAAWRQQVLSVGGLQHPVTVKLNRCWGPSEEEWKTIVNVIKTTPTLSLLQDLRIDKYDNGFASLTLKNSPV